MRGWYFSFVALVLVTGCGGKPPVSEEAAPEVLPAPEDLSASEVLPPPAVILLDALDPLTLEMPPQRVGAALRLAVAETGDIFILDSDRHRILYYGADGRLRNVTGGSGQGTQEFNSPSDLDTDGLTVWILDRQNRRLVRLNRELNYVEEVSLVAEPGQFSVPIWFDAVACATNGDVFLLDRREPQAVRISAAGDVLATYGGFGSGNGRLETPVDIAAGPDGALYVTDGRRLLHFDRSGNFRDQYVYPERLVYLEVSGETVWVTTDQGVLLRLEDGYLARVALDPAAGPPRPLDVSTTRNGAPVLLDASFFLWQFSSAAFN